MDVWDVKLDKGRSARFSVPEGRTLAIIVLHGTVQVNGEAIAREAQMALLARDGTDFSIEANNDVALLILSGEPIAEPVVGYGPFVMNNAEEIKQAIADFNGGKFGSMTDSRGAAASQ